MEVCEPVEFPIYPDILEGSGYSIGVARNGWGPGNEKAQGRTRSPAGPQFPDFKTFLADVPQGKPFCFWFGTTEPRRPYDQDIAQKEGKNIPPQNIAVPPFLPDAPSLRADLEGWMKRTGDPRAWEKARFSILTRHVQPRPKRRTRKLPVKAPRPPSRAGHDKPFTSAAQLGISKGLSR